MGNFVKVDEVKAYLNYTDSVYDARIQVWLKIFPDRVIRLCDNTFGHRDAYVLGDDFAFVSSAGTITTSDEDFIDDGRFKAGDNVLIRGTLRNDGHYRISTVTTTILTIDSTPGYGQNAFTDEDVDDEDIDSIRISLVIWPEAIKPIVANMLRYDMIERAKRTGVTSERIGNYSVTYIKTMGTDYPPDIMEGLYPWMIPAIG